MTIDTINISAFNLKVFKLDDYFNLPARKKILAEPTNTAADIVFQSDSATVVLMGKYADVADLLANLNAFETLLKTSLKHDVVLIGHGLSFTGVFDKGFAVVPYLGGKVVKLIVPVTIVE